MKENQLLFQRIKEEKNEREKWDFIKRKVEEKVRRIPINVETKR